jgi:hypothetical protein
MADHFSTLSSIEGDAFKYQREINKEPIRSAIPRIK